MDGRAVIPSLLIFCFNHCLALTLTQARYSSTIRLAIPYSRSFPLLEIELFSEHLRKPSGIGGSPKTVPSCLICLDTNVVRGSLSRVCFFLRLLMFSQANSPQEVQVRG